MNAFLDLEVNHAANKILIDAIKKSKNNKSKEEVVFNVYSIDINANDDEVLIYNDVFVDQTPVKLTVIDFLIILFDFQNRNNR